MQRSAAEHAPIVDPLPRRRSRLRSLAGFARDQPLGAGCAILIVLIVLGAVFADQIAPHQWDLVNNKIRLRSPSAQYVFGTDQFGRDILSRMLRGARVSLWVGLGSTVIGIALATVLGISSAYFGGWVDYALQRVVDVIQAIPPIILLVGVIIVLDKSITHILIALALRTAIVNSRVARSATLSVKAEAYIQAAVATGCGRLRIMAAHVLPNIAATMLVVATVTLGANVLAEASLSFLGYGIPPPEPSWGGMLDAESRRFMTTAPWMLLAPAIALSALVFAVNMLGDALRDTLDPRMRGR